MQAVKSLRLPGFALLAGLLLSASPAMASEAEQAEKKVEKAQSLMTEVRETTDGWGLWKSTRKMLGNAEQSLKQEDYEAAKEAAEEVIFEAKKGLEQYRNQKQNHDEAAESASRSGNLEEESWTEGEG